jgi:hypothetical protein
MFPVAFPLPTTDYKVAVDNCRSQSARAELFMRMAQSSMFPIRVNQFFAYRGIVTNKALQQAASISGFVTDSERATREVKMHLALQHARNEILLVL